MRGNEAQMLQRVDHRDQAPSSGAFLVSITPKHQLHNHAVILSQVAVFMAQQALGRDKAPCSFCSSSLCALQVDTIDRYLHTWALAVQMLLVVTSLDSYGRLQDLDHWSPILLTSCVHSTMMSEYLTTYLRACCRVALHCPVWMLLDFPGKQSSLTSLFGGSQLSMQPRPC